MHKYIIIVYQITITLDRNSTLIIYTSTIDTQSYLFTLLYLAAFKSHGIIN